MNARNAKLVLGAILFPRYVQSTEPCQDCGEIAGDDPTPWKVHLYGANKDRRAARKKRAKKLNRRR